MNVKEAVQAAEAYVIDLFSGQGLKHVGLEEVAFDDRNGAWKVTIGFFRDMDMRRGLPAALAAGQRQEDWKARTYKSVEIDDATGKIKSVKNRRLNGDLPDAG